MCKDPGEKWPVQGTVVILELGKAPALKTNVSHSFCTWRHRALDLGVPAWLPPGSLSLYRPLQGSQQMAWGRFPGSPGKSTFQKLCVFCLITLTNIHFLYLCRFFLKFFLKCNQNCLKNAGNPRDMRRFQVRDSGPRSALGVRKSNSLVCSGLGSQCLVLRGLGANQDGFI